MLALHMLTMAGWGIMAFQDLRDREVSWIIFPLLGLVLALLHLLQVQDTVFLVSVLGNLLLVSCILLVLWAVTIYLLKKAFLNVSFGLGDVLFMYALAMGYPTVTFIFLLLGSICFSLMGFMILKLSLGAETVPLAGLMGIFLIAVTLLALVPGTPSLYVL